MARLEPDSVLPAQFASSPMVRLALPEQRLALAILADAVAEFQRHTAAGSKRGRRLFTETAQWFAAEDIAGPFTFVNILALNARATVTPLPSRRIFFDRGTVRMHGTG